MRIPTAGLALGLLLALVPMVPAVVAEGGIGEEAPGFTVLDLDGNFISSSSLAGQPYLLEFMATWCPSCHITVDNLVTIYPEYEDQIQIISIDTDTGENDQDIRNYTTDHMVTWPSVQANYSDSLVHKYSVSQISHVVLVDGNGRVLWKDWGESTIAELRGAFDAALAVNDGGSGGDAGPDVAGAVLLEAGDHVGGLHVLLDQDWYLVQSPGDLRIEAEAEGGILNLEVHQLRNEELHTLATDSGEKVSIDLDSGGDLYLNLSGSRTGNYTLAIGDIPEENDDGLPGFTVILALAALLVVASIRWRDARP